MKSPSVMVLAMWVATVTLFGEAVAQPLTQTPAREAGIQSVLIKLEENKDAFERYVSEQLTTGRFEQAGSNIAFLVTVVTHHDGRRLALLQ